MSNETDSRSGRDDAARPGRDDQTTTLGDPRAPADSTGDVVLERGDSLGRYVVLSCVGTGGMGVVYAAYDPELDRKVAVKLMRASLFETPSAGSTRRLMREAQALAKLNHPNVVAVHDTGTVRGQVMVAMEFVAGESLRAWGQTQRDWREVLAVYQQAGAGLAAAHDAGLVHRDFKPSNAVLGDDGRVRVLDFGLARSATQVTSATSAMSVMNAGGSPGSTPSSPPARDGEGILRGTTPLDDQLTAPGQVLGTPAFMAPEQLDGTDADARSDQFSFCASLYEALFGEAPYPGDTLAARRRAFAEGPRDRATGGGVPAAVRRAVWVGLAPDPAQRYPSMHALLASLDAARQRRRRQGLAMAALVVLAATGWGLWSATRSTTPQCDGFAQQLTGVWDTDRRAVLSKTFADTGLAYGARSFAATAASLDAFGRAWVDAKTDACEATHVRGEQSSTTLDLRMACLDTRLRDVDALVDLLVEADERLVQRAVRAVGELQPLALCADLARLRSRVPPPADPATHRTVDDLREELGRVRALRAVGRYPDGVAAAATVTTRANALGYGPLIAEAQAAEGDLMQLTGRLDDAEQTLFDALTGAEAMGDDPVRVEAQLSLAWAVGYRQSRFEEGRRWLRLAGGTLARLGTDPVDEHRYQHAAAMVELTAGAYPEAERHVQTAIDAGRGEFGPNSEAVSRYLSTLGHIRLLQGRSEDALPPLEEMMRIRREVLGEGHPLVAAGEHVLGATYYRVGRFDASRPLLEAALEHVAAGYGADGAEVAIVLDDLAILAVRLGEFEQALDHAERSLAIRRALFDDDNELIARSLNRRGLALERAGRLDEAERDLLSALAVREAALGVDHTTLPHVLINVADLMLHHGRHADARVYYDRTERLVRQHLDPDHAYLGFIALGRGKMAAAMGSREPAQAALEEALARLGPADPWKKAEASRALGMVLWASEPARARELLEVARAQFARLGPGGRVEVDALDAWRAARGESL